MKNVEEGILDILILNLKKGCRPGFDRLYQELALPLLKRWNVDVIFFGPSLHEEETYLVVRRYKNVADRSKSQDEYYNSHEWKDGPREQIMSLIESYSSVVVPANEILVDGFRMMK